MAKAEHVIGDICSAVCFSMCCIMAEASEQVYMLLGRQMYLRIPFSTARTHSFHTSLLIVWFFPSSRIIMLL